MILAVIYAVVYAFFTLLGAPSGPALFVIAGTITGALGFASLIFAARHR